MVVIETWMELKNEWNPSRTKTKVYMEHQIRIKSNSKQK